MSNNALVLRDGIANSINRVAPDAFTSIRQSESVGNALDTPSTALLEVRSGDLVIADQVRAEDGLTLTLGRGAVVDARGAAGPDIVADQLSIEAGAIGSVANPLEVSMSRFAGLTFGGGAYLQSSGDFVIGRVGSLNGLTATGGNIEVNAGGSIRIDNVRSSGMVSLHAPNGSIRTTTADAALDLQAAAAELVAQSGIGATGVGDLNLEVETLTLTNTGVGSVYLSLLGSATAITGIELADRGSLFINAAGDLSFSGTTTIFSGAMTGRVNGSLSLAGDLLASGTISLLARQINGTDADLLSRNGDLLLRSSGDILFDANSQLSAPLGRISTTAGGLVEIGSSAAGQTIDLRAIGSLTGQSATLLAPMIRLYSGEGSIRQFVLFSDRLYFAAPMGTVDGVQSESTDDFFRRQIFGGE